MNLAVLIATFYLVISWGSSMLEDGHITVNGFWTGLIFTPVKWWILAWAFKTTGLF